MNVFSVCIWSGISMSLNKTRLDSRGEARARHNYSMPWQSQGIKVVLFSNKIQGYLQRISELFLQQTWNMRLKKLKMNDNQSQIMSKIYINADMRYDVLAPQIFWSVIYDKSSSDILWRNPWQNLWMYGAKTGTACLHLLLELREFLLLWVKHPNICITQRGWHKTVQISLSTNMMLTFSHGKSWEN